MKILTKTIKNVGFRRDFAFLSLNISFFKSIFLQSSCTYFRQKYQMYTNSRFIQECYYGSGQRRASQHLFSKIILKIFIYITCRNNNFFPICRDSFKWGYKTQIISDRRHNVGINGVGSLLACPGRTNRTRQFIHFFLNTEN